MKCLSTTRGASTGQRSGRLLAALLACHVALATAAYAQSSTVEKDAAEASYLPALEAFNQLPKRQVVLSSIDAAALSAQALSLTTRAAELLDTALKSEKLTVNQRSSLLIRRGTIEYQAGRYTVAKMFATRAEQPLGDPSPLRAEAILLGAQSDEATGAFAQAELEYLNALAEVTPDEVPDVYFLVAGVQRKLQKNAEARSSLEQIPLQAPQASKALYQLAELSFGEKDFQETITLLEKGKNAFPYDFSTGKASYLELQAAAKLGDTTKVTNITTDIAARFPNSDSWRTLIEATAEKFYANQRGVS